MTLEISVYNISGFISIIELDGCDKLIKLKEKIESQTKIITLAQIIIFNSNHLYYDNNDLYYNFNIKRLKYLERKKVKILLIQHLPENVELLKIYKSKKYIPPTNINHFLMLDENITNNKSFIIDVLKYIPEWYEYICDNFKNDIKIKKFVIINSDSYLFLEYYFSSNIEDFYNDKFILTKIIKNVPKLFKNLPEDIRNDVNFVKQLFEYSSLNNNEELILNYAGNNCKNNSELLQLLINKNFKNLKFGTTNCQKRILLTNSSYKFLFKFANEDLKNDLDFFTKIIKKDPHFIKYGSNNIKDNKELIINAIKKDINTIQYASEKIQNLILIELLTKFIFLYLVKY